ncbi:MAG: beta-ketoacyl-ACP synthase III [Pseudomonadota bacterium]
MSVLRCVVKGSGSYLPEKVLTNDDLSAMVDTSNDWIIERTGIRERHIAAEGEKTSDLAVRAAQEAMRNADVSVDDIDLIVVATATPDLTFPATATIVQRELGVRTGAAFDLQAVCSGFVYGLSTVEKFLISGQHKTALLIGAETFSRILDWKDRTTCVLFGDGAGAFVLKAEEGAGEISDQGVISSFLRADGRMADLLYVDGGPSATQTTGYLRMQGNQVFRQAVQHIAEAVEEAAEEAGVAVSDINWFVPHQANARIITAASRRLGISSDIVVNTVEWHGNTSAASIPLAFHEAVKDGRIKRNDLVMLEAMGGGFTWGAALLRY